MCVCVCVCVSMILYKYIYIYIYTKKFILYIHHFVQNLKPSSHPATHPTQKHHSKTNRSLEDLHLHLHPTRLTSGQKLMEKGGTDFLHQLQKGGTKLFPRKMLKLVNIQGARQCEFAQRLWNIFGKNTKAKMHATTTATNMHNNLHYAGTRKDWKWNKSR